MEKGHSVNVDLISIVILTKNEASTIREVIQSVKPYAGEVIVVDSHSEDNTRELAEAEGAVFVLDHGRGKGDGVRVGIQHASKELVVFVDADCSYNPQDIPKLVLPLIENKFDMMVGSRAKGGSDELHGGIEKLIKVLGSDIITFLINVRWKTKLTDTQSGFIAIRKSVAKALELKSDITTIHQEMTMKCLKKGYRVGEVPTHEYKRKGGSSSVVLRRVWHKYLWNVLQEIL